MTDSVQSIALDLTLHNKRYLRNKVMLFNDKTRQKRITTIELRVLRDKLLNFCITKNLQNGHYRISNSSMTMRYIQAHTKTIIDVNTSKQQNKLVNKSVNVRAQIKLFDHSAPIFGYDAQKV